MSRSVLAVLPILCLSLDFAFAIFNGTPVTIDKAPYVVQILKYTEGYDWICCTGSLISPTQVLTSQSCVDYCRPSAIIYGTEVTYGKNSDSNNGTRVNVISHEKHRFLPVSILELNASVTSPMAPLNANWQCSPNQTIRLYGFGRTTRCIGWTDQMLEMESQVAKCKSPLTMAHRVDDKATCEGDEGAPITDNSPPENRSQIAVHYQTKIEHLCKPGSPGHSVLISSIASFLREKCPKCKFV